VKDTWILSCQVDPLALNIVCHLSCHIILVVATLSKVTLVTFFGELWFTIDSSFVLKSANGLMMKLSNSQTSITLDQIEVGADSRTVFLIYNNFVQDFILSSTSEDTYQLSLEVLPGAFEFATDVQGYVGVHQLQHTCKRL
jgi:hypothetical protein